MEEWKQYKLGEVAKLTTGFPFDGHKYSKEGIRVVRGDNVTIGSLRWDSDKDKRWSENFDRASEFALNDGDIVIGMDGSRVGKNRAQVKQYDLPLLIAQRVACVRHNELSTQQFLYYHIFSDRFEQYIKAVQTGTSIPHVSLKQIGDFPVFVPSIKTQQKIASILKSLDDKIEVNRKINENLEQQAQALFKSWFVDFEPFKNGEFVESELGRIPKGWRVGRYDDIIESTISGDWGKERPEGNYTHRVACIRGCDFQDIKNGLRGKTPERYILEKNFLTKHFKDKDVLVEISGGTATVSTGRVCPVSQLLIDKFNEDIVCTNFCRLVRPKPSYGAYLYYSWLYKFNNKVMFGYENGTSGIKNFRIKDFTSLEPIIIPPESSLQSFQSMIDNLQMKLQMNGSESQKLATLRDTLLPKLMSGELKVNEIEK